jgi:hypothetical protein
LPPHAWAIARCPLRAASSTDSPGTQSIVMLSGKAKCRHVSFSTVSPVPFPRTNTYHSSLPVAAIPDK